MVGKFLPSPYLHKAVHSDSFPGLNDRSDKIVAQQARDSVSVRETVPLVSIVFLEQALQPWRYGDIQIVACSV